MANTEVRLTGMMQLAFYCKAVKNGVREKKEDLLIALEKANEAFSANYDSNEPLLQKQFISRCSISVINGKIDVAI